MATNGGDSKLAFTSNSSTIKEVEESDCNVGDLAAASAAHKNVHNNSDQEETVALLKNAEAAQMPQTSVSTNSTIPVRDLPSNMNSFPSLVSSTSKKNVLNTKRAEQNRKAQRAFRRKREERFRELEKKAQLVDYYQDIIQSFKNEIVTLRDYTLTLQSKLIEYGDRSIGMNNNNVPAVLSGTYLGKLNNLGNLNIEKDDDLSVIR